MADSRIYRGGIPYAADVKRLREAFPSGELAEGRLIPHEALEAIIECKRGTQRYYGVVGSWIRGELNQTGTYIAWQTGDGLKVLSPSEILARGDAQTLQKIRQLGRATKTYAWVDRNRLDDIGQRRLDHQQMVAGKLRDALADTRHDLACDLAPVKSLPKPAIIRKQA